MTPSSGLDVMRLAGSMVLVLLLLGGMLWLLRRLKAVQNAQASTRQLQVIESISLGTRQKVALVRVGNQQVLVGVSPGQLTALGSWPEAVQPVEADHAA